MIPPSHARAPGKRAASIVAFLSVMLASVMAFGIYLSGPTLDQGTFPPNGQSSMSITSATAVHNATASEYAGQAILVTSTVSLSAPVLVTLPCVAGETKIVTNSTTGGQSLYFACLGSDGGAAGLVAVVPNGPANTTTIETPDGGDYVTAGGGGGGSAFDAAAFIPWTTAQGGTGLTSAGAAEQVLTSNGTAWTSAVPYSGGYASAAAIGSIATGQLQLGMLAYDQSTAITYTLTSLTAGSGGCTAPCANGTWSPVSFPSGGSFSPGVATVCTSNVNVAGAETSCNGVSTSVSRVLAAGQTTTSQNGLWTTGPSGWTRTSDANATANFVLGKTVAVLGGTLAGAIYVENVVPATLGTNPVGFIANSAAGSSASSVTMGGDIAGQSVDAAVANITGAAGGSGENGLSIHISASDAIMALLSSAPLRYTELAAVTSDGGLQTLTGEPLSADGGPMSGQWEIVLFGSVGGAPGCDRGSFLYCVLQPITFQNSDGGAGFAIAPTCSTALGGFGGLGSGFTATAAIDAGAGLPYLYPEVAGIADAGPGCVVNWSLGEWRTLR